MQERVVAAALERLEKTFDPTRDALVVEAGTPGRGMAPRRPRDRGVEGRARGLASGPPPREARTAGGRERADVGEDAALRAARAGRAPARRGLRRSPRGHRGSRCRALRTTRFREEAQAAFAAARDDEEWSVVYEADAELAPAEVTPQLVAALARARAARNGEPEAPLPPALSLVGRPRPAGRRSRATARPSNADGSGLDAVGWSLGAIPGGRSVAGRWDVLANLAHDPFLGRPGLTVLDAVRAEARVTGPDEAGPAGASLAFLAFGGFPLLVVLSFRPSGPRTEEAREEVAGDAPPRVGRDPRPSSFRGVRLLRKRGRPPSSTALRAAEAIALRGRGGPDVPPEGRRRS